MSWLHTHLPAPGKTSLELAHRLHNRSTKRPYIADGCDQQGRAIPTREAASACSELLEDKATEFEEYGLLEIAFWWAFALSIIMGLVLLVRNIAEAVPL